MLNKVLILGLLCACAWLPARMVGEDKPTDERQPAAKPTDGKVLQVDAATIEGITVYPPSAQLDGPRSEQRFIVLARLKNGQEADVTDQVAWEASSGGEFAMDGPIARPRKDGQGKLTVRLGHWQAQSEVVIKQAAKDLQVDFATEVIPALNKLGCNQGACHGAQHGKGGFRLSLFGFDPPFDHEQIVKSAEGRRVVLGEPEQSLLLLKPTLRMEHGGGERMKGGSPGYERLLHWLEQGAPGPRPDHAKLVSLDVFPRQRLMQPEERQQIVVQARWSDGRLEDVTSWCQYDAMNEALSRISASGLVACLDRGESHIMIRFMGQAAVFTVTSPFPHGPSESEPAAAHFIDRHFENKWRQLGLSPSPVCSDEVFLRRVHLDLIGTLPTPEEIKAFLADARADKRTHLIEQLLDRPEFIDYWALKWGDLLRNNRAYLDQKGMWSLHHWVRGAIRDEMPMDQFVKNIVTAQGSTYREGPANFFRIGTSAMDWAETTSQVFLGVRLQCAKCHHHPFEKWSQDDYYGMAAFFTRVGSKNSQEFGLFGRETVIFVRPNGEQTHPRKGGVVRPHPLDGPEMNDELDRRFKLAEWIVDKNNPFFARNMVNRFWAYLLGRGIVEPVDDLRATNPPIHPELLDALAQDWIDHGYSLKHLLKTIATSKVYQHSSDAAPGNASDVENKYFTRYPVKRLTAEQLADALDDATGSREKYPGLPLGTRAIQLPDSGVRSYLLDVFGRPKRQIVCECERTMSPNIAQALHLVNGDVINGKISRAGGRIDLRFKEKQELSALVEELYLVTVSRPPKPEEMRTALELMQSAPAPRVGAEDLLWALLNSREFLFNH